MIPQKTLIKLKVSARAEQVLRDAFEAGDLEKFGIDSLAAINQESGEGEFTAGMGRAPTVVSRKQEDLALALKAAETHKQRMEVVGRIVQAYQRPLVAFLERGWLTGMRHASLDAEDIAIETFMQLVTYCDRLNAENQSQLRNWIFAVARNRLIDGYRKRKLQQTEDNIAIDGTASPQPDALERMIDEERLELLERAITSLENKSTQLVVRRKLAGVATAEIARELELNPRTIHRMFHSAKKLLIEYIAQHEPE